MNHNWTSETSARTAPDKRVAARRAVALPARLMWKDQRGAARFATVVTRDVSEQGVYVECRSPLSIPLYRLVQFQVEPDVRIAAALPSCFHHGRILSAVYRVSPPRPSKAAGIALRLMVDPRHMAAVEETRATA